VQRPSSALPHGPEPPRSRTDEPGILGLLSVLLSRWRLVIGVPVIAASTALAGSFLDPDIYTATVTFVPEQRPDSRLPSGLAGIASQFGISIGGEASQSPRFYAELVKSRELLERLLLSSYTDARQGSLGSADSVALISLLGVKGRDQNDSVQNGVRALDKLVSVKVDNQTHIVKVSVDSRYPTLAAAIANRIVAYLNDFNTKTRQSQARERRKFVEQRIVDGEHELHDAEENLRAFYERNRTWQQAPQLISEQGRLHRQVEIRQEVYLTLRREYETARIEEVNDTPVITILDRAIPPSRRSRPNRGYLMFAGAVLGSIASVLLALGGRYVERARIEDGEEYQEFKGLVTRVRQEIAEAAGLRRRP